MNAKAINTMRTSGFVPAKTTRDRRGAPPNGPYAVACPRQSENGPPQGQNTKPRISCVLKRTYFCGAKKKGCHPVQPSYQICQLTAAAKESWRSNVVTCL
jgi:hypothetical protein